MTHRGIIPQLIERNGQVLHRYTCRYMSQRQAEDKLDSLFADGVIDNSDTPVIHERAIYIR